MNSFLRPILPVPLLQLLAKVGAHVLANHTSWAKPAQEKNVSRLIDRLDNSITVLTGP